MDEIPNATEVNIPEQEPEEFPQPKGEDTKGFKEKFIQHLKGTSELDETKAKEPLDLSKEEIEGLSTSDYIDYLELLDKTFNTDLAANNLDIIIGRFETDTLKYSTRSYPERQLALDVGGATRMILFDLTHSDFRPSTEQIEKLYSFVDHEDHILSFQAAEMVDGLVWLDQSGTLFSRYLEDVSDRLSDPDDKNPMVTESLLDVAWASFGRQTMHEIFQKSLTKAQEQPEIQKIITAFSNRLGLEEVENFMRKAATNDPQMKTKYESVIRSTFNAEGEVYEDLRDLYEKIHFESYQLNDEVNGFEENLLVAKASREARFLDIGAGTGRLMKGLQERGREVVGFDFTARHAKYIKEHDPKSKVLVASWLNMPFKGESFDAAYCLGRSFTHNTTDEERKEFFKEAHRVIKEGGLLIVDIPNPDKGSYLENRTKLAEKLESEGLAYFEEGLIFDSPDQESYFTRLAPMPGQFEALARLGGFTVEDKITKELPTGKGDENIYYVLRRTSKKLNGDEILGLISKTRTSGPLLRFVTL